MRRGRFGKPDRLRFFPVQMGQNMVFFTKKTVSFTEVDEPQPEPFGGGDGRKIGPDLYFFEKFQKIFQKAVHFSLLNCISNRGKRNPVCPGFFSWGAKGLENRG